MARPAAVRTWNEHIGRSALPLHPPGGADRRASGAQLRQRPYQCSTNRISTTRWRPYPRFAPTGESRNHHRQVGRVLNCGTGCRAARPGSNGPLMDCRTLPCTTRLARMEANPARPIRGGGEPALPRLLEPGRSLLHVSFSRAAHSALPATSRSYCLTEAALVASIPAGRVPRPCRAPLRL